MKMAKFYKYNDLVADTLKHIRLFRPEISMIKLRIESLIERDYIKRDEKDK